MAITHLVPAGSVVVQSSIMATVAEAEAAYPGYTCIDGALHRGGPGFVWLDGRLYGPPTAWRPGSGVQAGEIRGNGGEIYRASAGGTTATDGAGPAGDGSAIADGTATWDRMARYA